METRVGVVAIIVENLESVSALQSILSQYADIVIGRMGIPYKEKGIKIISLAVDGEADKINAMTGKIGRLSGIQAKTVYSNV